MFELIAFVFFQLFVCLVCYKSGRKDWHLIYYARVAALCGLLELKVSEEVADIASRVFDEKGAKTK